MKNHIKKEVKKKTDKMKIRRLILISIVFVGIVIGILLGYWSAIPVGLIIMGVVWFLIPVKNIHVYPHDIRHGYHKKHDD